MKNVTEGFEMLMKDTDGVGQAFMEAIAEMAKKSSLDRKVHELAYISVLVATKMLGGLPFHIDQARKLGASVEEIRSAILLPMPIIGIQVADALPYIKEEK